MSPQQLERTLHKLLDNLSIKGRTKFRVEINEDILPDWLGGGLSYKIKVFLINDHSKYCDSSPNFSSEYFNYINKLYSSRYDIEVYELFKYLTLNIKEPNISIFWEHYNTDVYEPLLKELGIMKIPYKVNFSIHKPFVEIILDERFPSTISDIQKELGNLFSLDGILIYFDKLSSI